MASAELKYRSVKFTVEEPVKDYDIVRALIVQYDEMDIERVHPMPGNVWIVVFKDSTLAELAANGFILKEKLVYPIVMARKFVTATVAYVPLDASLGEIRAALDRFADVISLTELYIRDFPDIKNGKLQAVLKRRSCGLPAFFQIRTYKASLFFSGGVSCCPYCEKTDHLGRDCQRKHEKMLCLWGVWPFPTPLPEKTRRARK